MVQFDQLKLVCIAGYCIIMLALRREYSHRQKNQRRLAQDMVEQRATNPTEEKTCSINVLADNELRFRDMDLHKVGTEHDQRF